jgi:clostripain
LPPELELGGTAMIRRTLILGLAFLVGFGLARAAFAEERPWVFLVYGAADNNADGPILEFLDELRVALDDDPGVELLLLIDRHPRYYADDNEFLGEDFDGTRLYRVHKTSVERLSGEGELPSITLEDDVELDTADPETLAQFIAWAKVHHPAQHYGLMIYSHADGRVLCPDETSKTEMGIAALTAGVDESLDFVGLELCNMAGVEIAYEWRPRATRGFSTEVMVAIPNAGPPLDWERAFARLRSPGHAAVDARPTFDPASLTPRELGALVVDEGRLGRLAAADREPGYAIHECAACFEMSHVEDVKRAFDAVAVALAQADVREAFFALRDSSSEPVLINYTGQGPYVDAYDLLARLRSSDAFPTTVHERADAAASALDAFVVDSFGGSAYPTFARGKSGAFIVMPAGDRAGWREFSWYSPHAQEVHGVSLGGLTFLSDGQTAADGRVDGWFELLDFWLDGEQDVNGVKP